MSPGLGWPPLIRGGLGSGKKEWVAKAQAGLAPLLNNAYEDAEQLDEEIELVARILVDATSSSKQPRGWKDNTLSC